MSDNDFAEGDLVVYSIDVDPVGNSSRTFPATVFRVTRVDEEHSELHGDVMWTNDDRIDASEVFAPPLCYCEKLE